MQSEKEVLILDVPMSRSSLIEKLVYIVEDMQMDIQLRYKYKLLKYAPVERHFFEELCKADSIGKMYLQFIKPNFKQVNSTEMSDKKIKGVNIASNKTRFIKMSINVKEINKAWLVPGEKGDYLCITLALRPDGEVDKYTNLGMVTQDVPKSVYEKEKSLPKAEKTKGNILGNGFEFPPFNAEGQAGLSAERELTQEEQEAMDAGLPF